MARLANAHRLTAEALGESLAMAALAGMRGDELARQKHAFNVISHMARETIRPSGDRLTDAVIVKRGTFRIVAEGAYRDLRNRIIEAEARIAG